jgi:ribosomal protein S14
MVDPNDPTENTCEECGEPIPVGHKLCRWCLRELRELDRQERERDE